MSVDLADAIRINLLSPAVLFFALGILATLARSDLRFPEPLYVGLTIYLLIAIGFKGGVSVAKAGLAAVWWPALAAMVLGALVPLWTYPILRIVGRISAVDAAAIAAHYGSVSAVTFIAATNFLQSVGEPYEPYASAFLAVMEAPAIVVGVILGKLALRRPEAGISDGLGEFHGQKILHGEQVIFAGFVDDPDATVFGGLGIGEHDVDFADVEGDFVAVIADAGDERSLGASFTRHVSVPRMHPRAHAEL